MEQKKILCSNENKNITKHISVAAKYNIILLWIFLLLLFLVVGMGRKTGISKKNPVPYPITYNTSGVLY